MADGSPSREDKGVFQRCLEVEMYSYDAVEYTRNVEGSNGGT